MEQDVHAPASDAGPGIDARGAAFPGVNLYVELGRGRDYAWSATSAGQDIIDTFAVPLCGGDDEHYRFRGECLAMEKLERTNSWVPSAADQTPPGTETLVAFRTKLGIVTGYGKVKGKPRRLHPAALDLLPRGRLGRRLHRVQRPRADEVAAGLPAGRVADRLHVQLVLRRRQALRLLQLGQQPGRHRGVTGQLPAPAKYEWQGYDPATWTRATTRRSSSTRGSSTASRSSPAGTTSRRAATRPPTPTSTARSTARSCSTARSPSA